MGRLRVPRRRSPAQTPAKVTASAVKLALLIGLSLFAINHGAAQGQGNMTAYRWLSTALGFAIPFAMGVYCPCARRD
ncbi:MAG: nitrate/nitrite transporter NrtS [Nodosilinea sp.]